MGKFLWGISLFLFLGLVPIRSQVIYTNDYVEVIRIQDEVFLLKQNYEFTANCLAIVGEDGILLLDSGFGEIGEHLVDALKALGKEVKVIVNSHAHHDHMGANALFGKEVEVVCHASCQQTLSGSGQSVTGFTGSHTFTFNGHLIFCMDYAGGHSSCDILTFIPDLKVAFLGDLFFSESFPLVVFEEGGNVRTLLEHLNEVYESLPEDTRMFPGHGKETTLEYFGGYIALLEETVEVVLDTKKSRKSLLQIQQADVLKKWSKWGESIPFITRDSWIEQIYLSYE